MTDADDIIRNIKATIASLEDPRIVLNPRVDRDCLYLYTEHDTLRRYAILHPRHRTTILRAGYRIHLDLSLTNAQRRRRNKARAIARHNRRKATR